MSLSFRRPSPTLDSYTREVVAVHEAGHAVAAWFATGLDRLHRVAVLPDAGKGCAGLTEYGLLWSPQRPWTELVVTLAGFTAEVAVRGSARTSGSARDLDRAREIATDRCLVPDQIDPYVTVRTPPWRAMWGNRPSWRTCAYLDAAYRCAYGLLGTYSTECERVTTALQVTDELTHGDLVRIIGPRVPYMPTARLDPQHRTFLVLRPPPVKSSWRTRLTHAWDQWRIR